MEVDDKLTSVDWNKVEEKMESKIPKSEQDKIENFAENIVGATMARLGKVLGTDLTNATRNTKQENKESASKQSILLSLMGDSKGNETLENFADVFSNVIMSVLPPGNVSRISVSSDVNIDEKDLTLPRSKYHKCPPLGSPVFRNGTLVSFKITLRLIN